MQLLEDGSGGKEAREAGTDNTMRRLGIVAYLKQAWNMSPVVRSEISDLIGRRSQAVHRAHLIPRISF